MNPDIFEEILNDTVKFIESNSIQFRRGDVAQYFKFLTKVNFNLTLPIFQDNGLLIKAVYLKNLFVLWNIIVDDEIDMDKKNDNLEMIERYEKVGFTQSSLLNLLLFHVHHIIG